MTSIVYKKSYSAPQVDKSEALRYAGVRGDSPEAELLLDECIAESAKRLTYKLCYAEYPLTRVENKLDFGFCTVCSQKLFEHLSGCDSVIIFGATVGIELDRLIAKYGRTQPSRALMLQALGAERVEALCDVFYKELADEKSLQGMALTSRFSAGYGDLSLEFQRDIFRVLNLPQSIGLTLSDSLLMSPAKSVTAIIGIKKETK